MPQGSAEHDVIVWTDPPRLPLVQSVLGRMKNIRLVALGGPRKVNLTELADSYGVKVHDDFRRLTRDHAAAFLLLATSEGVTRADLQQLRASPTTIIAVEPPAPPGSGDLVIVAPCFRQSKGWLAAAEPKQVLGPIRSLHLTELAPPEAGSLYARLYDALDCLLHFRGLPDSIDAALTGPLTQPPDDLRALTGHLTAHLRFGSDGSATLLASDRAAAWDRRLIVLAAEGQLTLGDDGYRLVTRAGEELGPRESDSASPDAAELIAHQWQRLIDNPAVAPPSDAAAVVACCQAALLSCRTGEHESPQKLLDMSRA